MTGMTPEEAAQSFTGDCEPVLDGRLCASHGARLGEAKTCLEVLHLTELIRARDAEVRADERAKVLAGFTEERKDRRSCGCRVPVNALWSCCFGAGDVVATERRLVGPWEPTR